MSGETGTVPEQAPDAPRVSVIITVYNGERYIRGALESVVAQTFQDWECIVLDDGSTDGTGAILDAYRDSRLRVLHQGRLGRGRALNRACALARGKYLAVLDADDAWLPERLARQVAFLDEHPEVGVVGAGARLVTIADGASYQEERRYPAEHQQLRRAMTRYTAFCHSAMLLRRSVWEAIGGYDESLPSGLDFDIWVRAMTVSQAANLADILVLKRFHPEQRFRKDLSNEARERVASRLRLRAVRLLGLPPRDWLAPLAYYLYARLPRFLKPSGLKARLARRVKRGLERSQR